MMNDRTFPIPSNTISVKFEDYTNKSLQMDSNPATMEVFGASCRSVRAKFSAYSRVIRKAGCASHAQKHPRFGQMCKRCAESVQPLSCIKKKKNVKSYDFTLNIWCTSRTHIRTFLRFHGFPESDRFRTFLIIKGNENLIIVEIDGIDEGVHQCLPLLRLGHVQLPETEQPSHSNFLIVCNIVGLHIAKYAGQSSIPNLSLRLNRTNSSFIFGLASRSSAMRACSSFR